MKSPADTRYNSICIRGTALGQFRFPVIEVRTLGCVVVLVLVSYVLALFVLAKKNSFSVPVKGNKVETRFNVVNRQGLKDISSIG